MEARLIFCSWSILGLKVRLIATFKSCVICKFQIYKLTSYSQGSALGNILRINILLPLTNFQTEVNFRRVSKGHRFKFGTT